MDHTQSAKKRTAWTYGELRKHGYSRRRIETLVKEGKLVKLLHGTYTTRANPTGETVWEAINLVRAGLVLDGRSAIEAHEVRPLSLPLVVRASTGNIRTTTKHLLRINRSQTSTFENRGGYRVVLLAEAIRVCLEDGSMSERDLRDVTNARFTGESGITRMARELAAMGTKKKTPLRTFLDSCVYGTDSGLESQLVGSLHRKGFKTKQNFRIGGYKWDVCIEELKVVIDVDSRKYHGDPLHQTFIVDRWKTNHAQLLGWTALRITEDCVGHVAVRKLIRLLEQVRAFRTKSPRARLRGIVDEPVWMWHMMLTHY